jgi:hypothetical protein
MVVKFVHDGKTYQFTVLQTGPAPPAKLQVLFKPRAPLPAFLLELRWVSTDALRMIEMYEPVVEGGA